jgi:hypothetical protein
LGLETFYDWLRRVHSDNWNVSTPQDLGGSFVQRFKVALTLRWTVG